MQVLLLENVRFYKEEEKNDIEFAKKVCEGLLALYNHLARSSGAACGAALVQSRLHPRDTNMVPQAVTAVHVGADSCLTCLR